MTVLVNYNPSDNEKYKDQLLFKKVPTIDILGVNIAAVDLNWTIDFLKNNLKALSGKYICVSNVHTTIMSYKDRTFQTIQNCSVLSLPDGGPLSTVGKLFGNKNICRVAGPNLMEAIFNISEEQNYSHYFYGSTEYTLNKLRVNLTDKFAQINILSTFSPPYREITEYEDQIIVGEINRLSPDFIWVGLGAPKQEIWMFNHINKVNGLMIGVGAGFDYFAGNIKRAPMWMQNSNLEWLFRFVQDPRRLFIRYLKSNTLFIFLISKEIITRLMKKV